MQIIYMDMRNQEIRFVPRFYRIAQHLCRVLTDISESLPLNLTFPGQDFCSKELNQTLFTVPEVVPNKPQFFMSYQNSESRTRQIQARGVYDKGPRVDRRVSSTGDEILSRFPTGFAECHQPE